MKKAIWAVLLAAVLLLPACSSPGSPPAPAEPSPSSQTAPAESLPPEDPQEAPSSAPAIQEIILDESGGKNPSSCGVPLYIGTEGDFTAYKGTALSQPTPDDLVAAIGEVTGWNLSLAQPVEIVEDGYSLVFSQDCALVTGPPDPQKEEFHVFDQVQLVTTALDSIRQTLRVRSLADGFPEPDQVQIYISLEGGQELSLPEDGIRVPMGQPYHGVVPIDTPAP